MFICMESNSSASSSSLKQREIGKGQKEGGYVKASITSNVSMLSSYRKCQENKSWDFLKGRFPPLL